MTLPHDLMNELSHKADQSSWERTQIAGDSDTSVRAEALKQPDMFIEKPKPAKQKAML